MLEKKIMILGASILQLPAILKSKEMGLKVISVDMDENAIGFKHADVCIPISTTDVTEVVRIASEYKIDGILTIASDMPMRTVAAVSENLGLVGITKKVADNVTNKVLMRKVLRDNNVPIPAFFEVNTFNEYLIAIQKISGKFIIKPADNSGSRGVILVDHSEGEEAICSAFEYSKKYSKSGELIVEEFMMGQEVSVETLSFNNHTYVIAITDKLTTGDPNFVELGHSIPAQLSKQNQHAIAETALAAITALGITNGPTHTEIILCEEGPKVVEVGARLGGDNITTHLVPLSTGVDMVEASILIALGETPIVDHSYNKGAAIRYIVNKVGKVEEIQINESIFNFSEMKVFELNIKPGEILQEIKNSNDRKGYVIVQSNDALTAIEVCENILEDVTIKYEN